MRSATTNGSRARASASVVVALVLGALAASCTTTGSPTPGATEGAVEPTPTGPVVTIAPTPVPGATSAGPCAPAVLEARVAGWSGAAGSRIASVELRNTGADPCAFRAIARPQLVDGAGTVLIDGVPPGASMVVLLAPDGLFRADVRASNYCGADPVAPVSVAFVLPDGLGRVVAAPESPTSTDGLPPCLGPGQAATIEMQPWGP